MKSANPATPIPAAQLPRFREQAQNLILNASWRPNRAAQKSAALTPSVTTGLIESSLDRASPYQSVNLGEILLKIGDDGGLPSEEGTRVLHAFRRGLQIASYVAEFYRKQTSIDELMRKNRKELTGDQQTEYAQKSATEAAITVFVAAYYAYFTLSQYKADTVGQIPMELPAGIEVSLIDPINAVQCLAFYLGRSLEAKSTTGNKLVTTGSAAVRMAVLYFEKVLDDIKLRVSANALKFTEPFVEATYLLEGENFSINGFETDKGGAMVSSALAPLRFDQIVGNRRAKLVGLRQIHRLCCYDLKVGRNPNLDAFGEFSLISIGKGFPGTGKTMLARAKATELARICNTLEIPYLFWQLPTDLFDEFQGKSGKKMAAWCRAFADDKKLIYGLIDDAENTLKSREGSQVAEATEGVNSVFLNFSEGAGASRNGNWILDLLTNLIHKLDAAVLSRIQDRTDITGAETLEDFLDQDYLWHHQLSQKDPIFVDMKDPPKSEYVYMTAQGQLVNLSQLYDGKEPEVTGDTFKRIFTEVRREHDVDEHMFFAALFYKLHEAFPNFTSRDVRNIQVAVNDRRMDFDYPAEWFEGRAAFADQPYERKIEMLQARQRECLKGQTLKRIRLQETIRYLNVTLAIPEQARRKAIEERRDAILVNFQADKEARALLAATGSMHQSRSEAA